MAENGGHFVRVTDSSLLHHRDLSVMMGRVDRQEIVRRQGLRLFALFSVGFFGGAAAAVAAGTSWAFLAVNVVVFTVGGRWALQAPFSNARSSTR